MLRPEDRMTERWTRREILGGSLRTGVALAAGRFFITELTGQQRPTNPSLEPSFRALDSFVHDYMRVMDAPGMTLVIANRGGIVRAATYGFSNLDQSTPVDANQLFEIGSISKSFVAIAVLQLAEEKKIDLHKPIAEFMQWMKVDSQFAPITVHHLLTHTSGLPERLNCLLADPNLQFRVRYAPGEHFSYCNLAYQALGYLIWQADGRPFADAIRERILRPLKMQSTEPVISGDARLLESRSYNPLLDDRPLAVGGRLKPAPPLVMDNAAGCISSTPSDMGRYIQMIANRGAIDGTRILSENAFAQMTRAHTKAEAFGPTASYGYGLAVDTLDGHTIVRHTGGMVSFASSMQVDLDEGVGVFASINAMQGYRPNPIAQYALQLMRAANNRQAVPNAPPLNARTVPDRAEFAGLFTSPAGPTVEIVVEGTGLAMIRDGKRLPVDPTADGRLVVRDSAFDRWPLNFQREKGPGTPVTDLVHGPDWYFHSRYTGSRTFTYPPVWDSFTGHFRNDSPWYGSLRVVKAKGHLWIDGVIPLEADGDSGFWLNDPPYNPGRIEFTNRIGGACMHARLSGEDFWRVMVP
jgi:CubicO group peptidase (beta-lactamase class C family)